MKLCKTCKHATKIDSWVCRRSIDIVTGDALPAREVRTDTEKCGPTGAWHELRYGYITDTSDSIETPMATIHRRPPTMTDYKLETE